jgi:ADP-ribosylglycohydrolase
MSKSTLKKKNRNKNKNNKLRRYSNRNIKNVSSDEVTRYEACFILYALGDTIGFKNGEWEFNFYKTGINFEITNEIVYDFIWLGGINAINLDGWNVSDDTIIHMAIIKSLLKSSKNYNNDTITIIKDELISALDEINQDEKNNIRRAAGVTTVKYIEKFKKGYDGTNSPYDKSAGGNGAAMRTLCIGLAFRGVENRDKLIKFSIESSKLTHNSAIGYLGGLVAALFTAYAIEDIEITKWPFLLIELLESSQVKMYIGRDQDEQADYFTFINNWKKYVDSRFDDDQKLNEATYSQINLIARSKYYYDNFTRNTPSYLIGESGYSATIMAYDALIDAKNVWEKLIFYSALHFGDSDTVAAIACGWYGTLYGYGDVPSSNLSYLEFKKELIDLSHKFYEKFN